MIFRRGVRVGAAIVLGAVGSAAAQDPLAAALDPSDAAATPPPALSTGIFDVCSGSETPEGEPACFNGYVDDFNGGFNSTPPVYSPIACGDEVCGTTGTYILDGATLARDTDWYRLETLEPAQVTWTATAGGFPHRIAVVDIGSRTILDYVDSAAGEATSISVELPPGAWALFVAPKNFTGVPCGSEYVAHVECATRGACCLSTGCLNGLTPPQCALAGGNYQGDQSLCQGRFTGHGTSACTAPLEDISDSGIVAEGASEADDGGEVVPIGFGFPFFDGVHTEVGVASNGYLTFGSDLSTFENAACPDPADPNALIAPLWDDWSPNLGGDVRYQTVGMPGEGLRFIAQWTDVPPYNGGVPSTFQAVLYEDGAIEFRYGVLDPNRTPTIGIESADGSDGVCFPPNLTTCARIAPQYEEPLSCGPPPACPGDLDGSGDVGFGDVLTVIGAWGECPAPCPADLDGSGDVGFADILVVIAAWGDCPTALDR